MHPATLLPFRFGHTKYLQVRIQEESSAPCRRCCRTDIRKRRHAGHCRPGIRAAAHTATALPHRKQSMCQDCVARRFFFPVPSAHTCP